jgi:hypothetical protein
MENRRRGGGNQGRKHRPHRASDTRNPIRQKATQPPISTLADRPGSATPRGAPEHPMSKSYSSSPSCISVQYPREDAISKPIL